jgi:hypothetical protein
MEVSGQFHALVALPTGVKALGAGCASEPVLTLRSKEKFLASIGNRTPFVQHVARRYTG